MKYIAHVAGEPKGDKQLCERCRSILSDARKHFPREMTHDWKPGATVYFSRNSAMTQKPAEFRDCKGRTTR